MTRFRRSLCAVAAVLSLLLLADQTFAWGPATHVALGNSVLSQLALLPAGLAALLGKHAVSYLYGNIAADIVFAKRLSRVKQFCHHWSTGFRLLKSAESDQEKAFAFGYLSHLAADTVAHGKYVPRQIMVSGCSVNFGHFYWELRADGLQPAKVWGLVRGVIEEDHEHHHEVLSEHLKDTLLSFETNRVLFERINAFAVRRSFRASVDIWGKASRFELCPQLMGQYHNECVDRIVSVLSQGERCALLREDPNGTSALMQVKAQRKDVRWASKDSLLLSRRRAEAAACWLPSITVAAQEPLAAAANAIMTSGAV